MSIWEYMGKLSAGIPGVAAAVFVYLALSCLIKAKERWWYKALLLFGCWLISSMIIFIGDWFNLTVSLIIFLIILWIVCEGTSLKKLTLGLMFSSTVYAFSGFYDNGMAFIAHYYGKDEIYGNMYLFGRFFFAAGLYLVIRIQKPEQDFELSPALWRLMLMLTFSPLGIMLSLILLRSPFSSRNENLISDTTLFLVVILSFVGLLRALTVLERQRRLERENALAVENRRYYEAMEQQQFEIRRLKHDLSNHLQTLLALPEQQKDEYIKGMLDNPAFGQVLTWCGDLTVNAVLTAKESLMRQKEIRFTAKMDIREELPFEKADICTIFANALDNAVEGCMKVEKSRREIWLDAREGKGILAVNIKNSCQNTGTGQKISAKDMEKKIRLLKTTKKDKENHGFGLKSIQKTVKRHGGNMEIKQKTESFELFLYLPMEKGDL